jgi:predicted nuclease of predicted toxin-antitoxin system
VRFLLDHDVPEDLIYLLEELQHEVVSLRDVLPTEADDAVVLESAYARDWILMTCNRDDFLNLAVTTASSL